MKIILISVFCVAKCLGGKYQMHFSPANTICKFVNQFSFVSAVLNESSQTCRRRQKILFIYHDIVKTVSLSVPTATATTVFHTKI
ncbi:hypothetical protein GJV06_18735 [Enterobacteriaceae bacterium RIT691]|nr:hypothetical protein [Enterobacteriaceae bacterium RIT691]